MSEKKKIALIRVLTTQDQELLQLHGRMIESCFPSLSVESRCIADQDEGVHDEASHAKALPKVLALARAFAAEKVDAVYISCAGDPGVRILQRELAVPVIGAGTATAHAAGAYGVPVGVLGITDDVPEEIAKVLGERIVGSLRPPQLHTTLDLFRPDAMDALAEAGRALKSKGAKLLLLACTGLATINAAPELRRRVGLPVLDPLRCAAACLWSALC
ncbi:MAG: aspartate/glutamate racemase family protein [Pyramidobacter porci]|uniref:aspartate/glutamate racemase family protein n=1 Tax=Pyramidobacter porci TaxID=2605789 RepID=UPI002A756384|nr:aspartate/glutamate racemase family protein [Pyramidobacter porci]MDY2648868.1 aspartate/glutamate racemase family protein [Pyramidobacter porci]